MTERTHTTGTEQAVPRADTDRQEPVSGEEAEAPSTSPQPPSPPPFVPMSRLRASGYFGTSVLLALAQGFGQSVVSANVQQLQGGFGATQAETTWLVAAYLAPNVSLTLALIKIRAQYGLRNFAELSIIGFLLAALLNYAADGLWSNMAVRFLSGMAAAPMTSLAFLYMLEPLPPEKKLNIGLSAALTAIFMGSSVTRLVSPHLLEVGLWHGLTAFEAAMAAIGFGLIYLFPLNSPPRSKVIESADVISFLLIAVSFGALAVSFTLGPLYWWFEQPWLGVLLAVGVAAFAVAACIELNRTSPLIDIRWLTSPPVLHFAGTLLLFRLVLSEQSSGAAGLFRALGLLNDQTRMLWVVVLCVTILGGVICAFTLKPERVQQFHIVSLSLLIVGSLMDARATSQIAPSQMYLSQGLIAMASALFLPPALLSGLLSALARGPQYLLSFIVVFISTQKIGGVFGSALFSTFVQIRQKLHLTRLYEALPATDPMVASQMSAYGAAYSSSISDPAQLAGQAATVMGRQVATQASVLAYNDAFLGVAALSTAALALLLGHVALDGWRARRKAAADAAVSVNDPANPSPPQAA
ncbi:MFS transporter [Pseudooceanicola sediminis]|uniref:MFS transporter n=1 Tax=Pseudooceanicola sediminis TaxID=2211117 RepID=UPI0018F647F7|nr:MFS transporter [Pseudooceanicola sediminis]|tara:strand:+ start:10316 stop:12064 length:1749 start_codon:yes stop_codon:yes gene_type:complete